MLQMEQSMLIGPGTPPPPKQPQPPSVYVDTTKQGVIYFVEAIGMGLVKIGWSSKPVPRIRQINSTSPVDTRVLGLSVGTPSEESYLHRAFKDTHHRFEWFHFSSQLRLYIERNAVVTNDQSQWQAVAERLAAEAKSIKPDCGKSSEIHAFDQVFKEHHKT